MGTNMSPYGWRQFFRQALFVALGIASNNNKNKDNKDYCKHGRYMRWGMIKRRGRLQAFLLLINTATEAIPVMKTIILYNRSRTSHIKTFY